MKELKKDTARKTKKTRNLTMTNQKMATVMQRSTLSTLYSVLVHFHFSDKFLLLLLTLLFVQTFPTIG